MPVWLLLVNNRDGASDDNREESRSHDSLLSPEKHLTEH